MLDLDMMRRFAFASAAVHMVLGLVLLGALGGHWLDGHLQTYPWLTMALPLLGLTGGLYRLMVLRKRLDTPNDEHHPPNARP